MSKRDAKKLIRIIAEQVVVNTQRAGEDPAFADAMPVPVCIACGPEVDDETPLGLCPTCFLNATVDTLGWGADEALRVVNEAIHANVKFPVPATPVMTGREIMLAQLPPEVARAQERIVEMIEEQRAQIQDMLDDPTTDDELKAAMRPILAETEEVLLTLKDDDPLTEFAYLNAHGIKPDSKKGEAWLALDFEERKRIVRQWEESQP
jgi:hypothetical protein